jgi:DNA invertase Pin-like site-specific DNA recombinase
MNQPKIKVCLFIRVSMQKQDYNRQVTELTTFCAQKGWEVTKIIANKITGTKSNKDRHDIDELFKTANGKTYNKVVVSEISRIGRTSKGIRSVIDYLHDRKIAVVFKNLGGLESLDDNGSETMVMNIVIAVHAEMAQEEKREQRDRIISGLEHAKKSGKILGRPKEKESRSSFLSKYKKLVIDIKRGLSLNELRTLHKISKNTAIKARRYVLEGV